MSRTTPPRPVDLEAVFPALAPLARTATRLHPSPGTPSVHDSSIGGPLLWPATEAWPHCSYPHSSEPVGGPVLSPIPELGILPGQDWRLPLLSPADARVSRRIMTAANARGERTAQENEILAGLDYQYAMPQGPIAMLPVAQLYTRDVPGLRPPAGADLLQVLWCPFDHDEDPEYAGMPKTELFWRSAASVTDILLDPPQPTAVQDEDYVPEPCVIHPEQIVEYPYYLELERDLREQVERWTARQVPDTEPWDFYSDDESYFRLSISPGWKIGGYIQWGMQDPYPQPCPACGTPTEPLLTIAYEEWNPDSPRWIPYELMPGGIIDLVDPNSMHPSGISIRGGYNQIIRVCPESADHPHVGLMQ